MAGMDFAMAFSPAGGSWQPQVRHPKVVGDLDHSSSNLAQNLYDAVLERVVPISSTQTAEI